MFETAELKLTSNIKVAHHRISHRRLKVLLSWKGSSPLRVDHRAFVMITIVKFLIMGLKAG